jgi:hypothetical protein
MACVNHAIIPSLQPHSVCVLPFLGVFAFTATFLSSPEDTSEIPGSQHGLGVNTEPGKRDTRNRTRLTMEAIFADAVAGMRSPNPRVRLRTDTEIQQSRNQQA